MKTPPLQRLKDLARSGGIFRTADARASGVDASTVWKLWKREALERVSIGVYRFAGAEPTPHHSLALACGIVPRGVICLLSALSFHELGTQSPPDVWVAAARRHRLPLAARNEAAARARLQPFRRRGREGRGDGRAGHA
ncbi:MAG: type IV toxin-antitoxin system AbiEi family antitoxin domain-containing protein [Deltaproteobacteria bacterium]|nr:type IV toxin-antitoxin system AbiEi family antitoxin domain-containing protein [Deltaproteobacteria bacterium]